MAPNINLDYYAEATEGFSGADLQALIYDAHLEVVHSSLEKATHHESEDPHLLQNAKLEYTSFGGPRTERVMSRAEQDGLTRRVCFFSVNGDVGSFKSYSFLYCGPLRINLHLSTGRRRQCFQRQGTMYCFIFIFLMFFFFL